MRCYNNHRRETNPSLLPYKGELQMKQKNYHSHARCEIPTRIYREKKMKQIILNTIIKRIVKEEVGDEFITKEREKKIWNDYKPFISFQNNVIILTTDTKMKKIRDWVKMEWLVETLSCLMVKGVDVISYTTHTHIYKTHQTTTYTTQINREGRDVRVMKHLDKCLEKQLNNN
jgi:hypothetical protein